MSQWDIYHPSFLFFFFGCFPGSWVPLLTSNLNKEAPVFDSTTVMRWLTRFSFSSLRLFEFFFYCLFSIFSSAFSHSVHWSTVTGGVALAEALRGWSALSWRDAIIRGGSAQRIRSTETTAGESTMGIFQVALVWGKRSCFCIAARRGKKRYDFLSSEGNAQSAGNGSIKTN